MTLFFLLTGSFRAIVKNNISIMNMNLKNLDAAYGITEKTPTNTRDMILIPYINFIKSGAQFRDFHTFLTT